MYIVAYSVSYTVTYIVTFTELYTVTYIVTYTVLYIATYTVLYIVTYIVIIKSGKSLVVIEERKKLTQRATDPLSFEKWIFRSD
jgi:hypothetical protein